MVKRTEGTVLKLSSINSKESVENFSKYLVSLLLLFKNDKKSFELMIDTSISYLPNIMKFTERVYEFNLDRIIDYVGNYKYESHSEIYYSFRKKDFISKYDNDISLLNESSMIADDKDMKYFIFEIAEKIYEYKNEDDYIKACKEQAENYLTNCIRFGLEKFSNYIFEALDSGAELKSLYECFFLDFESIDKKYNPKTFCEEKKIRQYNPTILGENVLSDFLERDLAYIRFHSGYEISKSYFYLSFMDIDLIYKLSKNKMKTFSAIVNFLNRREEKPFLFKNKRFYDSAKIDNVLNKLGKSIPNLINEYACSTDESFVRSGLYGLSVYIRGAKNSSIDSLNKSFSCEFQGIEWCKNLIKSISLLIKKLQSSKELGDDVTIDSLNLVQTVFLSSLTEFNKKLLDKNQDNKDLQIYKSLDGFVDYVETCENSIPKLKIIYQTDCDIENVNISNFQKEALHSSFDRNLDSGKIEYKIIYPSGLKIKLLGFKGLDITTIEDRLIFYCNTLYFNDKTRIIYIDDDDKVLWQSFKQLYDSGMVGDISKNPDIDHFLKLIFKQNNL